MVRKWTIEQSEVIKHRNGNLLVSAGAGAGKTAVLVERILSRLLEKEKPIRLDELLVVTFTRAAAAEMKERIGSSLEDKLSSLEEGDEVGNRLIEQYALLPQAEISTIDSFCKSVIMENFQKTDLDPSFRVADETELQILKAELLEEFLEEKFEEGGKDFLDIVDFFERGKQDGKVGELILELLTVSESFPNREKWYRDRIGEFEGALFDKDVTAFFLDFIKLRMMTAKELNEKAIFLIFEKGGAIQYKEALFDDRELIEEILNSEEVEDLFELCSEIKFTTLSRAKPKDENGNVLEVDEELKNRTKELRDRYKSFITEKIKDRYFYDALEEIEKEDKVTKNILLNLLKLSLEYAKVFSAAKRKKNLVDFSDLSHIALGLLVDEEGRPTEIAKEYRERFAEIMIDEYQDSNYVQEYLLTAISGESIGEPNLFMVGDVKQSIYGFRQAEPELFLNKYQTYEERGAYRKISLSKNFRSSKEVIDTVNLIFKRIMMKEVGGLDYDERAALVVGREDEKEIKEKNKTELLLYDESLTTEELLEDDRISDMSLREKEACMIGTRIKALIKEGWNYSDITILLRSMSGWAEEFKAILTSMGLPVVSETVTGYFSAWEVQVVLDFLSIIDNPEQDIPLASVLLSPIGNFTESELSEIRIEASYEMNLWEALSLSKEKKAKNFLRLVNEKRKEAVYTTIHELIRKIYEETDFYHFVAGMKGGESRIANLDMLLIKAQEFEATSLYGLNTFVRYIEKMRKYDRDFGEAEVADNREAIRIMSIHKSKGLEFPVVFVSGLSKGYNDTDARKMVVIHKKLGIATDYFNVESREESMSFHKNLIADRIRLDNLSEEIRVLYVALTRAKEKLILTGTMEKASETIEEMRLWSKRLGGELLSPILNSTSYMDLILPSFFVNGTEVLAEPKVYSMGEVYVKEGEALFDKEAFIKKIEAQAESTFSSKEEREALRRIEAEFNFQYPFVEAVDMKPSMTVSELKRLSLLEEEGFEEIFSVPVKERRERIYEDLIPYLPKFLPQTEKKKELTGTEKGSLIHNFLSKMDFSKTYTKDELKKEIEKLSFEGGLTSFDLNALYDFTKSDLASRMKEASRKNLLFRETPFTIGIEKEVNGETETIVVQGIIDAWFFENEEVILVDYKTDRVKKEGGEEELIHRYKAQLDYYAMALKRVTGREVKEKMIYSLSLFKTIKLE